jgi:protein-tyrosine phosphatase
MPAGRGVAGGKNMRTILFVCTGNTCRSPMAEAIARHLIDKGLLGEDPDIFVASAGVEMIQNADVVFGMTSGHVQTARSLAGDPDDARIVRLDPDGDIADPIGMEQAAYDALAGQFMELIPRRLKEELTGS